jgi:hypothetical protein
MDGTAGPAAHSMTAPPPEPPAGTQVDAVQARRPGGSLRGAVLDILEAHPDRQFKTGQLCKLLDAAADPGARKASAGAVYNALLKLAAGGRAIQVVERPATFQLATHR